MVRVTITSIILFKSATTIDSKYTLALPMCSEPRRIMNDGMTASPSLTSVRGTLICVTLRWLLLKATLNFYLG